MESQADPDRPPPPVMIAALPWLGAALYLVVRDGGSAPLAVGAVGALVGGALWLLFGGLGVIARVGSASRGRSALAVGAVAIWVIGPLGFAVVSWLGSEGTLGIVTPIGAAVVAAGLMGLGVVGARLGAWDRTSTAAMALTGLPLLAMWLGLVDVNGTLRAVRPGTEAMHVALFGGTWALSAGAAALSARRSGTRRALGGLALVVGVGLLEADRWLMVDLYPAIHLWLAAQGFAWLGLGGAVLLADRAPARLDRAATVALVLGAATAVVHLPGYTDPAARGPLEGSTIGRSLLYVVPPTRRIYATPTGSSDGRDATARFLDRPSPIERPNIVLVTVDALRHDALAKAPALEAFADAHLRFDAAYAQGSRTAIGMGTLLTGRYSAHIDWDLWIYRGGRIYDPRTVTDAQRRRWNRRYWHTTIPRVPPGDMLAERLDARGYATVAVPFAGKNQFFRPGVGFDRGFDTFVDLTRSGWKTPTSEQTATRVLAELDRLVAAGDPWFVWVHFYDPHEARNSRGRYAKLVGAFDRAFARLIARLEGTASWDRTVVAVVADHGEAFGEHGHRSHASSLFDEQIRVPLVMRVPGMPARRVAEPVAVIDLSATLAVLAGAETARLDGTHLLPMARGEAEALTPRPVFSELHRYASSSGQRTADLKAVRWGRWKLIDNRLRGTTSLFDLEADPAEKTNRLGDEPETATRLRGLLDRFLSAAEATHPLP